MESVNIKNVKITDGFWQKKQEMAANTTVHAVYDRFFETGRVSAFKCDKNSGIQPHVYWDSDVAKWIEGAAYLISIGMGNKELEGKIDAVVSDIEKNQEECGYFNSYYLTCEPENRFTNRDCHELYCLGHLIEGAIAYNEATGKDKFLRLIEKYVDYVEKRFIIDKDTAFATPGHEELELALIKLYDHTKNEKYLDMCRYFVNERGKKNEGLTEWSEEKYNQSHKEARLQAEAEGHSVRAVYFYSAMADLALRDGDGELKSACEKIFEDIVERKMYITGGIGSTHMGEAFTVPYDLPSETAYAESCAAIGLVFFAQRMLILTGEKKYADVIERVIYNGFLSSTSLDGRSYFYQNPLEIVPKNHTRHGSVRNRDPLAPMTRFEVFDCSCCPPNIVRFLPSIGSLLYTTDGESIYAQQFASSVAKIKVGEREVILTQKTSYPENGKISFVSNQDVVINVRVPEYLDTGKIGKNGYVPLYLRANEEKSIDFEVPVYLVEANPQVRDCAGKVALLYGPVVYCLEGHDNPHDLYNIRIDRSTAFEIMQNDELGVPTVTVDAFVREDTGALYSPISRERKRIKATLIPYYAFANRGETAMQVWTLIE